MFFGNKKLASTPFSEFIRNASSEKKKRVYKVVIERSTQRQKEVIERARLRDRRLAHAG